MHLQTILMHDRNSARIRTGNSVTWVSIDRFDSRELHRVPPRMKTIAHGVSHVCIDIYCMIDDEIKAALLYALIFDITLITLWYFIDFSYHCDGLIFYSSAMKNEYQDYSVNALSCASHGIHCILAVLFLSSISLSISLFLYQFESVFFYRQKKWMQKCPYKKKSALYLSINLWSVERSLSDANISHTRGHC